MVHFVVVVGGVDPGRLWGAIGCVAWPSSMDRDKNTELACFFPVSYFRCWLSRMSATVWSTKFPAPYIRGCASLVQLKFYSGTLVTLYSRLSFPTRRYQGRYLSLVSKTPRNMKIHSALSAASPRATWKRR